MRTSVIVCARCRRVVAVGGTLPATCLAAIPEAELRLLRSPAIEAHPDAHTDCVELEVDMGERSTTSDIAEVERNHAEQISALLELAAHVEPGR